MKIQRLEKLFLYDEGVARTLDTDGIAGYLRDRLSGVKIVIRGNPFAFSAEKSDSYARRLASIKVHDWKRQMSLDTEPLHGEVRYEKKRLSGATSSFGIIYDGFQLQRVLAESLPREERHPWMVHIVLTNRLFATWDENDRRYHARTSVYGLPSVISTTGLIEAPAKPREYYLLKQQYEMVGKSLLELNDKFRGRFIEYDDDRLTDIVKGYIMQAVFYAVFGSPFCQDKGCRLFNAHWQEELIFAQLKSSYEFCPRHRDLLSKWQAS